MTPSRASWTLGPDAVGRCGAILRAFLDATAARCAAVVDRAGHLLAFDGAADFDRAVFASLVAADFSASDQLAALLGEEEFATVSHHAAQRTIFLADVAGGTILVAVFDDATTLGLVRLNARTAVAGLAAVFEQRDADSGDEREDLAADWLGAAQDEIDRLFAD